MKQNFFTWIQKTQEFVLRLFVETPENSTPSYSQYYTCAHAGTHARLHQSGFSR